MSISEKHGVLAAIDKTRTETSEFQISGFLAPISFKLGGFIVIYWERNELMKHHSFPLLHSSAL
jgi:hypothetical protein